jgi:hypothetical protein
MADERNNRLAWDILLSCTKHSTEFENSDIKDKTLADYSEPNIETFRSSEQYSAHTVIPKVGCQVLEWS